MIKDSDLIIFSDAYIKGKIANESWQFLSAKQDVDLFGLEGERQAFSMADPSDGWLSAVWDANKKRGASPIAMYEHYLGIEAEWGAGMVIDGKEIN